jgi:hypothetical protein
MRISALSTAIAVTIVFAGLAGGAQAADVDPKLSTAPVVYRLNDAASYSEGCFGQCLCPVFYNADFRGTFMLQKVADLGTVIDYDVRKVNWYVGSGDSEMHITGSGTYQRISGFAGWIHRMVLDLSIDGGPTTTFDSGLINGGGEFPDIMIGVSINNLVCYDTLLTIDASPVPNSQIIRERLVRGSTYQEGCLPPCLCPIFVPQALVGTFGLVPISSNGFVTEFSVVDADFDVIGFYPPPSGSFEGQGRYTRITAFIGDLQRMELDLSIDGEPPTAFDSGLTSTFLPLPRIDVEVAMNGFYCYDIVLRLSARPRPSLTPSASVTVDAASR